MISAQEPTFLPRGRVYGPFADSRVIGGAGLPMSWSFIVVVVVSGEQEMEM
jgi:hypothetical protein